VVGNGRSRPVAGVHPVGDSVANFSRLSVSMELRETSRDQTIRDLIGPSRDLADAVDALADKVVFDEFYDFHFFFPSKKVC
jgi:hypothetical protein